jgi:hypothetical protein
MRFPKNNTEMVKLLERDDVDINLQGKYGSTALSFAVDTGDLDFTKENREIVELLLGRDDVDINLQDDDGWTALMYAADNTIIRSRDDQGMVIIKKNIGPVELLLGQDGVDLNLQNNDGDTLMYIAMENQDRELVQLLIDNGVEHISKNNCTMLHDGEECNLDGKEVAVDPITFEEIDLDNKDNYYRLASTGHCIHKDTYDSLVDPKRDPFTRVPIRCLGYIDWGE